MVMTVNMQLAKSQLIYHDIEKGSGRNHLPQRHLPQIAALLRLFEAAAYKTKGLII